MPDNLSSIPNRATEAGTGTLELQLGSDIPEISIDVSKLDITNEEQNEIKDTSRTNLDESESTIDTTLNDSSKTNSDEAPSSSSKPKVNHVWVSNVHKGIKATELKTFFSQIGRVNAVKILTNGKQFYGYVSMESAELASKCISDLNEALFQGDKITVSSKRPDMISPKTSKKGSIKKIPKNTEDNDEESAKDKAEDKSQSNEDNDKQIQSKIDSLSHTNKKLKRRLDETQRLYDGMCKKYNDLTKELNTLKSENREERRRLHQDKEAFERTKKTELVRIDADKAIINKELGEIRKLKETLKRKIDDVRFEGKRFKRDRSPDHVTKSPKRRSPSSPRNGSYKSDQKKYRRGFSRERTPSPPNFNSDLKKRSEVNNVSSRPVYLPQGAKHQNMDYRQNRPVQGYQVPRGGWMGYPKNGRRTNAYNSDGSNQNGRFNGGQAVQHPPSAVVVPPRAPHGSYYYPQW